MKWQTGIIEIALASALALTIGASSSTVDHAGAAQTSLAKAPASNAEALKADGSVFTIEMSNEQFQQFSRNRAALRERLGHHLRFYERQADRPLVCVKHPDGREPLVAVSVHFRGRMDGFQASLLKTGAELGSNRRGIMEVRRSGRRWLFEAWKVLLGKSIDQFRANA